MALSENDSTVLTQLFDPESAPTPAPIVISSTLPPFPNLTSLPYSTQSHLRSLEVFAIRAAESSDFPKALDSLTQAIEECKEYASAYNNRAQVLRMSVLFRQINLQKLNFGRRGAEDSDEEEMGMEMGEDMDNLFSLNGEVREVLLKAYNDLTTAITLTSPSSPTAAISPQQAKLLANAYTQRATILHTSAKHFPARSSKVFSSLSIPKELEHLGKDVSVWEEAASRDFFWGGRYGNELAKAMAVHTNPYAKLCGSIVKEAMKKEMEIGEAY